MVIEEVGEEWCQTGTTVSLQSDGESKFKLLYYDGRSDGVLTPSEARDLHAGGDSEALGSLILSIPPWKFKQSDADISRWAFPLEPVDTLKPGVYSLVVYYADWKSVQIPRSKVDSYVFEKEMKENGILYKSLLEVLQFMWSKVCVDMMETSPQLHLGDTKIFLLHKL
eukprot:g56.t1